MLGKSKATSVTCSSTTAHMVFVSHGVQLILLFVQISGMKWLCQCMVVGTVHK
jgi:hypothetical protein